MKDLLKDDFQELLQPRASLCVSLYMPTYRKGTEASGNPTRLKNLLREAAAQLEAEGLRPEQAQDLLKPAWEFLADHDWSKPPAEGLALFLSEDFFRHFGSPVTFPELVRVGKQFSLRPLLALLAADGRFYVLALSQQHVRLLQCTRMTVRELPLTDVPRSLQEIRQLYSVEDQVRWHSGPAGGTRKQSAIFHGGHGTGTDNEEDELQEFLRLVEQGVRRALREQNGPLVLAGVESVTAGYRRVNSYGNLLEETLAGNPEEVKAEELHRRAWELVAPHFAQRERQAREQYELAAGKGQALHLLEEALPAAYAGRLALLFVPCNDALWGRFDPESAQVDVHASRLPGDQDLLDVVASEALARGSAVWAVPTESLPAKPVAAVLRY